MDEVQCNTISHCGYPHMYNHFLYIHKNGRMSNCDHLKKKKKPYIIKPNNSCNFLSRLHLTIFHPYFVIFQIISHLNLFLKRKFKLNCPFYKINIYKSHLGRPNFI